jgi:hypothetical protein
MELKSIRKNGFTDQAAHRALGLAQHFDISLVLAIDRYKPKMPLR